MSRVEAVTQVIIVCDAALPRAAWSNLIAAQPGLEVKRELALLRELEQVDLEDGDAIFWASASRYLDSSAADTPELAAGCGLLCLLESLTLQPVIQLLQQGITGFITPEVTVPELARALIATGRKEIVLPLTLASQALAALARGEQTSSPTEALTEREQEVLTLLAQGLTNKDIAQSVFLSVRTIEAHLRSIYGKLNVASRTEAVIWAVRHGFAR